jgi:hypothetical protein
VASNGNPLPTGYLESSVKYYHSTLRNMPEERRSHHYRGGSLKSRINGRKSVFEKHGKQQKENSKTAPLFGG